MFWYLKYPWNQRFFLTTYWLLHIVATTLPKVMFHKKIIIIHFHIWTHYKRIIRRLGLVTRFNETCHFPGGIAFYSNFLSPPQALSHIASHRSTHTLTHAGILWKIFYELVFYGHIDYSLIVLRSPWQQIPCLTHCIISIPRVNNCSDNAISAMRLTQYIRSQSEHDWNNFAEHENI